jgi:hypothetical protein
MPRTRVPGRALMMRGSMGGSSDDGAAMVNSPSGALSARPSERRSVAISSSLGSTCRPAELNPMPRGLRVKSLSFRPASMRAMALLTCDAVTPSSRAAAVTDSMRCTLRTVSTSWRRRSSMPSTRRADTAATVEDVHSGLQLAVDAHSRRRRPSSETRRRGRSRRRRPRRRLRRSTRRCAQTARRSGRSGRAPDP